MNTENLVITERVGRVAVLTLNRPEARNAINFAMAEGICGAVRDCQDASAIIITGSDPAFCAGLDLRQLGVESFADLADFNAAVAQSETPVIAAVNGPAVTGGFELALSCDFIIASERAAFADTHLRVGVYPGPVLVDLPRRIGMARAREMSLTGNFIDAEAAGRAGLANHVVPHGRLLEFALELAEAMAEQNRVMVRTMRHDWNTTGSLPIEAAFVVHQSFARVGGYRESGTAGSISEHRDQVIERSRRQRSR